MELLLSCSGDSSGLVQTHEGFVTFCLTTPYSIAISDTLSNIITYAHFYVISFVFGGGDFVWDVFW